jgi:hypothetical protein
MGLCIGDRCRCGHLEREKKKKKKKKKRFVEANVREREKEGDRFGKEEELSVCLSHAKFVEPMNACHVFYFWKKKKKKRKKNYFNTPLRWIDRRTKSETFVKFRDEK